MIGKVLADDVVGKSMTSKECTDLQKKFCYEQTCKKPSGEKVDITSCVREEVEKNKRTTGEAISICEKKPEYGCSREYCAKIKNNKNLIEEYKNCLTGHDESYCYQDYCMPWICDNCPYYCYTSENKKVEITDCVVKENTNGMKFREALAVCKSREKACQKEPGEPGPGDCVKNCKFTIKQEGNKKVGITECDSSIGNGRVICRKIEVCDPPTKCLKPVVYRTIDLDNPFPANGKNAVTTNFSNDGTMGRNPRRNWFSIDLVKDNILEARGVKGNKLYTEKKPLYTIVLTPKLIKEIKVYNNDHSYSDFELSCKNEKGTAACISDFVHTTLDSAIDRNKSVANCYSMSKNEAGFNACYNKNN